MTYKITRPDGTEILSSAEDFETLLDEHSIVACIVADCPDADGYTLESLDAE